jgi:hypothetical protein
VVGVEVVVDDFIKEKEVMMDKADQQNESFTWKDLFGDVIIDHYSRAQALEDGFLIDVSEMAREAGFRCPVALTQEAWGNCVAWDDENDALQDEEGRLWDVLYLASLTARKLDAGRHRATFELLRIPNTKGALQPKLTKLVISREGGDAGETVFTIMKPCET